MTADGGAGVPADGGAGVPADRSAASRRERLAGLSGFQLSAFAALVIATVAAFFIAQHIKVSTPLISGLPAPFPTTINPAGGGTCYDRAVHHRVDYRASSISFYLLHASDRVDVYMVDQAGTRIATLATGLSMKARPFPHEVPTKFTWDGREQNGAIAPNGSYYFNVHLIHQGRTVTIASGSGPLPVTVTTRSRCP